MSSSTPEAINQNAEDGTPGPWGGELVTVQTLGSPPNDSTACMGGPAPSPLLTGCAHWEERLISDMLSVPSPLQWARLLPACGNAVTGWAPSAFHPLGWT